MHLAAPTQTRCAWRRRGRRTAGSRRASCSSTAALSAGSARRTPGAAWACTRSPPSATSLLAPRPGAWRARSWRSAGRSSPACGPSWRSAGTQATTSSCSLQGSRRRGSSALSPCQSTTRRCRCAPPSSRGRPLSDSASRTATSRRISPLTATPAPTCPSRGNVRWRQSCETSTRSSGSWSMRQERPRTSSPSTARVASTPCSGAWPSAAGSAGCA
mmetsp:Transcript_15893/g.50028  ORF Transcript_15893/g.50028 Transcript_15893/m.50028 type:complete len:216 (+) Transcript_15893:465-1112(+)